MPPSSTEIAQRLQQASEGLLYMSESDYPFEVFVWSHCAPLTPEKLLKQTGHPADTPVQLIHLDTFFQPMVEAQDWFGPEEHATTDQFRTLLTTIQTTLQSVQVYRVGTVQVDVYITGTVQENDTDLIGLATKVIET